MPFAHRYSSINSVRFAREKKRCRFARTTIYNGSLESLLCKCVFWGFSFLIQLRPSEKSGKGNWIYNVLWPLSLNVLYSSWVWCHSFGPGPVNADPSWVMILDKEGKSGLVRSEGCLSCVCFWKYFTYNYHRAELANECVFLQTWWRKEKEGTRWIKNGHDSWGKNVQAVQ